MLKNPGLLSSTRNLKGMGSETVLLLPDSCSTPRSACLKKPLADSGAGALCTCIAELGRFGEEIGFNIWSFYLLKRGSTKIDGYPFGSPFKPAKKGGTLQKKHPYPACPFGRFTELSRRHDCMAIAGPWLMLWVDQILHHLRIPGMMIPL